MIALCVDDERIPLNSLTKAVEKAKQISQAVAFDHEDDALEWARDHAVDIAFLDIELHVMNGLDLAKELIRLHPEIAIVFCTSYEQYALRALQMHIDAGYLVKPFRPDQVREEIDHIAKRKMGKKKLKAVCFGDFEIFAGSLPLQFRRTKSKELFAYLIDRRGATVSTDQICAVFWGDEGSDEKKRDYLYHLIADIKAALKRANATNVLVSRGNGYAINMSLLDCDYYQLLNGDKQAKRRYTGEYMQQYSWGESTNSWLERRITDND